MAETMQAVVLRAFAAKFLGEWINAGGVRPDRSTLNAVGSPGAFIIPADEHNAIVDLLAQGHRSDGSIMTVCAALNEVLNHSTILE